MSKNIQSHFDFSHSASGKDGCQRFRREWHTTIDGINERFGIFINAKAKVKLFGWDEEFTGKLVLDSLAPPTSRKDAVPLRIGNIRFDARDIAHCIKLE